jgi:hypothetical protein
LWVGLGRPPNAVDMVLCDAAVETL